MRNICEEIATEQEQERILIDERMYFVVYLGVAISVLALISNAFLIVVLAGSRKYVYYIGLGILDICLSLNYVALIAGGLLKMYYRVFWMHLLWTAWLPFLFTAGRMIQSAQANLIVTATIERYIIVRRQCRSALCPTPAATEEVASSKRYLITLLVLVLSVAYRIPSYWELESFFQEECYTGIVQESFAMVHAGAGSLSPSKNYHYANFKLYVAPIIETYIPFGSLLVFNFLITRNLRKLLSERRRRLYVKHLSQSVGPKPKLKSRSQDNMEIPIDHRSMRDVTHTMLTVIVSYLVMNIINVIVSFLEQVAPDVLLGSKEGLIAYTLSADISSFLAILGCALRMPLYCYASSDVRKKVMACASGRRVKKVFLQNLRHVHRAAIISQSLNDLASQASMCSAEDFGTMSPISPITLNNNNARSSSVVEDEPHGIHVEERQRLMFVVPSFLSIIMATKETMI